MSTSEERRDSAAAPHEPAAEPALGALAPGPSAAGERRALPPESIVVDRIGGWIFALVVGGGSLPVLALGWTLDWFPGWLDALLGAAWVLVAAGLGWLAHAWPPLEHRHTRWRVGPLGLDIWRGVVWRSVVSVPRSRVQHIDVTQGPLQRRFGLATLSLHTAGTEHARVTLAGLDHGTALRVRDDLLVREEDDVV